MGSELVQFINLLNNDISTNKPYIKTIRSPEMLLESCRELHDVIGNSRVKDDVAQQLFHLITVKKKMIENPNLKEDEMMSNALLYGPPGVGKTMIATKLAKIWYSLGYLDGTKPSILNNVTTQNADMIIMIITFIIILANYIWLAVTGCYKLIGMMGTVIMFSVLLLVGAIVWWNFDSISSRIGVQKKDKKSVNFNPNDDLIKVTSREDYIAQYVGWTTKKTNQLLNDNLGKVVFIDEAYNLIAGHQDMYGTEALTAINLFLSQNPKGIIVIMAGYKDKMEALFESQPGLKRRFLWKFDCSGYNALELYEVFKSQLQKKGWGIDEKDINAIKDLFVKNHSVFTEFGGDTEQLTFFSEMEHSKQSMYNDQQRGNIIDYNHIERGLARLLENKLKDQKENVYTNYQRDLMNMLRDQSAFHLESLT